MTIEYVDRASIDQPIDVGLLNKTIRQALGSILRNEHGYSWRLRNGIVEITNTRAAKHAQSQLNRVIPVFEIREEEQCNCKGWNFAQPNAARDSFLHCSQ